MKALQEKFPLYAANFPVWANQANGMLQINIWTALRELGVGANLQHYNPVIDDTVKSLFDLPQTGSSSPRCLLEALLRSQLQRKKRISRRECSFSTNRIYSGKI